MQDRDVAVQPYNFLFQPSPGNKQLTFKPLPVLPAATCHVILFFMNE